MEKPRLEQFKQQLCCLRDELRALHDSASDDSNTVELDQTKVGRLSRMDAMQTQQMALNTSRRREQQLIKIEGALKRIESGDFGFCFVCDEEISLQRLQADPSCTRCIACAE